MISHLNPIKSRLYNHYGVFGILVYYSSSLMVCESLSIPLCLFVCHIFLMNSIHSFNQVWPFTLTRDRLCKILYTVRSVPYRTI